jgi:hypothetical protein
MEIRMNAPTFETARVAADTACTVHLVPVGDSLLHVNVSSSAAAPVPSTPACVFADALRPSDGPSTRPTCALPS